MWKRSPRFWSCALIVVVIVAFLFGCYFSPWWAVRQIREAALQDNAVALSRYVDFEEVKFNLAEQMKNQVAIKFDSAGKANDQEVQALENEKSDILINSIVSPQGIADLLNWAYSAKPIKKEMETLVKEGEATVQNKDGRSELILSDGYGSNFNQFHLNITDTASQAQTFTIELQRDGFFGWKIINILLPLGF